MWEQPPLLSEHSFRPAERRGGGGEGEGGGMGRKRVEGRLERLNFDKYKLQQDFRLEKKRAGQEDKTTPHSRMCVDSCNYPAG